MVKLGGEVSLRKEKGGRLHIQDQGLRVGDRSSESGGYMRPVL